VLANPPLQEAVIASLQRDFRIPRPVTIAASAQGNVVILRGTIETLASATQRSTTRVRLTASARSTTSSTSS
jgi:hypothetical protein